MEKNRAIVRSGIGVLMFAMVMAGAMLLGSRDIFRGSTFIVLAVYYGGAAAVGILMIVIYAVLAARAKRMKLCLMLVQNEHITSVPKIARIMGMSHDKTVELLKKLISMDQLSGASIDEKLDEVVFGKSIWARQRVICRNCGAELIVNFGQTLICEYCGGKLETVRPRKFVEIEE